MASYKVIEVWDEFAGSPSLALAQVRSHQMFGKKQPNFRVISGEGMHGGTIMQERGKATVIIPAEIAQKKVNEAAAQEVPKHTTHMVMLDETLLAVVARAANIITGNPPDDWTDTDLNNLLAVERLARDNRVGNAPTG